MRHGRGHVTSVGGRGTSVEAGGRRWRQGNIDDSWGMLVGGRKRNWEPVRIYGGRGLKVGAGAHQWGPGHEGGG